MFPVYKYKQSSVFASKIGREGKRMRNSMSTVGGVITHSVGSINKLGGIQPFKQLSPNGGLEPGQPREEDEEEYYDEDDDDGRTPGPGSYFNPQTSTTFKQKNVPEKHQFFGSTVERFNRNGKQVEQMPGPGTYTNSIAERNRAQSAQQQPVAPFLSTNVRFMDNQ